MKRREGTGAEPLGLVWIDGPHKMLAIGLARVLRGEAWVHLGRQAPAGESPSLVILCTAGAKKELSEDVKRIRSSHPEVPIFVFGLRLDLPLARAALGLGTQGFIHRRMQPEQIVRALEAAKRGEPTVPGELIDYLIRLEDPVNRGVLTHRQREILELVAEGLTNAQIAERLFLSESTVKWHLRAMYKLLRVSNRREAAELLRADGS